MTHHDPMAAIDQATTPTPPEEGGPRIAGDTPTLQEVTRTALRAQQAQADLTHAASRARQAGDSIAAIAGAAGVTRQTIYRWTSEMGGDQSAPLDVRDTLDMGLAILASHGDTTAGRYVGGRGTIVGALAAWKTGLLNVGLNALSEEERAMVGQVSLVVGLAERSHAQHGTYPRRVTI